MFLSRIFRSGAFNWKYAIGEILLIFIGISLSLLFDEWRTTRSKQQIEKQHVQLLIESVTNDLVDLEYKINESKVTINKIQFLLDQLRSNPSFDDSISTAFGYIAYNPQFAPDLSGIKNLEGAGLTTIADLNFRTQINRYYSRVQDNMTWASGVDDHIDNFIAPRIITDFKEFTFIRSGIPFDYKKTRTDHIFLNTLKRSYRLNTVSLDRLQTQKEHAQVFLQILKKYIGG
jgi:hypothetical protein